MNTGIALVGLLVILSSCADPFGVRRSTAIEARELWSASRPEAYEMTYQVSCGLCLWYTAGTTVNVDEAGNAVPIEALTVDRLFEILDELLSGGPLSYFEVTYDAQFGYPIFISVDRDDDAVDDEWTFRLDSLVPVASS